MATNNYDVNYDDERFAQVQTDKNQALTDLENTYGDMIGSADKYYQDQINASQQWADKQSQLQQEQTDFTIEKIEQQKDQARKDYLKEQSGAYVDWQKQSNQYGAEAERQASAGMTGTGFSESSQVSMFNTYQNRVATARETFANIVLNYDNSINEAKIQNNAVLAEIAYEAQKQQLELSLQGFQYKNNLILEQANKKVELDNTYYSRYLDVLNQINTENAMAEEIRQFNQTYDLQVKQYNESVRQFNQEYDQRVKEYNESIRQFNEEIARLKKKDEQEYQMQIKELELKKKQMEEEKRQFEESQKLKREQLAEEKRQFDKQYALSASRSSGGGGSSGGGSGGSTPAITPTAEPASEEYTDNRSDLGLGPISDKYLAQLISQGRVTYKKQGNKIIYSWSGKAQQNKKLIDAQTSLNKYTQLRF